MLLDQVHALHQLLTAVYMQADWFPKHRLRRPAVAVLLLPKREVEGGQEAWARMNSQVCLLAIHLACRRSKSLTNVKVQKRASRAVCQRCTVCRCPLCEQRPDLTAYAWCW